jgi:hypothetical protein
MGKHTCMPVSYDFRYWNLNVSAGSIICQNTQTRDERIHEMKGVKSNPRVILLVQ